MPRPSGGWPRTLVDFLAGLARWPGTFWRLPGRVLDRLDERVAVRTRRALGPRGWLVSWQRCPDGRWLARLSGPESVRTIERSGRTRVSAVSRSARAFNRLSALRKCVRDRPFRITSFMDIAPSDSE
jgi:hypothetical protein